MNIMKTVKEKKKANNVKNYKKSLSDAILNFTEEKKIILIKVLYLT